MRLGETRPLNCSLTGKVTAAVLLSFLTFHPLPLTSATKSPAEYDVQEALQPSILEDMPMQQLRTDDVHRFTLRHIFHHGTYQYPNLHRKINIQPEAPFAILSNDGQIDNTVNLVVRSRTTDIQRLEDRRPSVIEPMLAAARKLGDAIAPSALAWTIDNIIGPDVTDKSTVINMANMAANAYAVNESDPDWEDLAQGFNRTEDFGWDSDGLRGHVYADETNSTIVIGFKGTTRAVFDGDGTTTNDKWNDNLFASCCCAQQGARTWRQVCDCATSAFTCNQTCVVKALRNESRYYAASRNIFTNVTQLYPDSEIWLTGHSLGGAVSGLLGLTYGLSAVTFEAVPDALAAARLGLPQPPESIPGAPQTREMTGTYHFGHTADPIYMGTCNGAFSFCSMGGYAFESQCHTGQRCVYDVVSDKGWRVSIGTHGIKKVIKDVIKAYDTVPECAPEPECIDCYNWKYYESNSSITSTTSSSSSSSNTRTRTSTCKTPGWWGCLDETTTTTATTTTTTTTTTSTLASTETTTRTTTCKTPGWFGRCLDEDGSTTTTLEGAKPVLAVITTASPTSRALGASDGPPALTTGLTYSMTQHMEA